MALYTSPELLPAKLKRVKILEYWRNIAISLKTDTFFNRCPWKCWFLQARTVKFSFERLCKKLYRSHKDQQGGSFLKQWISMALEIGNAAYVLGTANDTHAFGDIYNIVTFQDLIRSN